VKLLIDMPLSPTWLDFLRSAGLGLSGGFAELFI